MNTICKNSASTLRDCVDLLEHNNTFSPTRARNIRSACNSLAKALKRDLSTIPASPSQLRFILKDEAPPQSGIGRKRWQNIRSDIMALLKQDRSPSVVEPAIHDAWQKLLDILPKKHQRSAISGFATYCKHKGVTPTDVTDQVMSDYHHYLINETLRKKPNAIHRDTCRTWNQAVELLPEWPQQQLTQPNYQTSQFTIPWPELPASLSTEVEEYLNWLEGKTWDRDPPSKIYADSTIKLIRRQLHALVSAATPQQDANLSPTSLNELCANERLITLGEFYSARFDNQQRQYLHDLLGLLLRMAKHWLDAEANTLDTIKRFRKRMGKQYAGLTKKNQRTIQEFQDPKLHKLLLRLPETLELEALKLNDRKRQAVWRQLALAIDLLIHAPMRSGNLVSLHKDKHLLGLSDDMEVRIIIEREEVKNDVPLMFPLPEKSAKRLRRYLREDQPILGGNNSPWIFPGELENTHKEQKTLCQQIQKYTSRYLGVKISPHQFRHLAADLILRANPGAYPLVQRVLGHRSMKTAASFYSGMEMEAAVKSYDDLLTRRSEQW